MADKKPINEGYQPFKKGYQPAPQETPARDKTKNGYQPEKSEGGSSANLPPKKP